MSSSRTRPIATSLGAAGHRRPLSSLSDGHLCFDLSVLRLLLDQLGRVAQLKKRFTEKNTKVNSSCDTHAAERREY